MLENKIKCQRCWNDEVWNAGKPRRKQQYKCKDCKRKFITELTCSTEFKQKAIAIFYEGNSGRAVGRIIGINKSTVYNWIKKLNKKNRKSSLVTGRGVGNSSISGVTEMDKLFAYTKAKKTEFA